MSARITTVVAVAVLVLVGISAVSSGLHDAGDHAAVKNESFAPNAGIVELANSDQDDVAYDEARNVTVYNNSSVVNPDGNYSWVRANGTLDVESESYLASKSSANVSYGFAELSADQQQLSVLFAGGFDIARLLILLLTLAFVLMGVRILGGVS